MITGDQLKTACAIAAELGILQQHQQQQQQGEQQQQQQQQDAAILCARLHQDDDPSLPFKPNEELDPLVAKSVPRKETKMRYFCSCSEYRVSRHYVGWVTNIDYYSPSRGGPVQVLGAAKGRHAELSAAAAELLPFIKEDMQQNCPSPLFKDELGWCRPPDRQQISSSSSSSSSNLGVFPSKYADSSSRGAKMARTAAFIAAVWCEMLRAYTGPEGSSMGSRKQRGKQMKEKRKI
ncbi:P-ATPase, related [Eimeria tenella]|uniref:p-ATPase, related n=1 Tax=Eimeria tenella TaxID=5802 RepID=U6KQ76_EIMTE|nr:P-ATPase, related [Eimeria tenella]CDJ38417.1 P-ATPase, related [Eimeria tenella]|eukprot:XP_013229255.1 P-ATPase, related [Eimeria tenella]